jgi:hypothetical protein
MPKYLRSLILVLSILLITSAIAIAGGLSTTFVEIKLRYLQPGNTYSIREMKGRALIVNNTTEDITVDIEIEAEKPADYNLVSGYEPIPDLSWITIEKNSFKDIGPGESAETDILISIPKGKGHIGRKYQVYIYSHTAGQATFRMGLMSRVLIEVGGEKGISPPTKKLEK